MVDVLTSSVSSMSDIFTRLTACTLKIKYNSSLKILYVLFIVLKRTILVNTINSFVIVHRTTLALINVHVRFNFQIQSSNRTSG